MKYERWLIPETDDAAVEALMDAGYPYLVSTVLASRGVVTPEQAAAHLDRERSLVYSPFLMRDMDKAVARIDRALAGGETIAVFGDYDVDGITSTCLLTDYLRSRGAAVLMHIPRRINAAGRMGRAELAAELLLTQDPAKAERLARELCDLNRERQSVEQDIFRCAIEQMDTLAPTERNALVLSSEEWHQGVVGIVASRLSEKFSCPSFMIHLAGGMGKGSCRSYGGFNLFAALEACSDLLVGFGGHELAAGFTIKEENIPAFRKRINQYVRTHCGDSAPVSSLEIDAALTRPSLITLQEVEDLSRLEPYGAGNNRPVFCLRGARLESMQSVGQNKHLKLRLQKGHTSFDGIFFSVTPAECGLTVGERVDAAFYLQVNEFRGSRSLQLQLVDLRSAHDPGAREAEQLELCRTLIRGGGVSAKDAAKLLPSREQFVRVWRALEREVDGTLTSPELPFLRRLSADALGAESFPRTVMCLAVFAERGLVTVERHDKYITLRLTGGKRVDLDASPYLCALREGLDGTKGGSSV